MDKSVVKTCSAISLFFIMMMLGTASAEDIVSREYKIKATYLYNLIKFIRWPNNELKNSDTNSPPNTAVSSTTRICIYGHNPFSQYLDKLTLKKAKGKKISVKYIHRETVQPLCDMLFIAEQSQLTAEKLQELIQLPVLSVGESSEFLDIGGLISLTVKNNNVQLQINHSQAKAKGFEISSNLLEIAKRVK